jgi:hypothetical protein
VAVAVGVGLGVEVGLGSSVATWVLVGVEDGRLVGMGEALAEGVGVAVTRVEGPGPHAASSTATSSDGPSTCLLRKARKPEESLRVRIGRGL